MFIRGFRPPYFPHMSASTSSGYDRVLNNLVIITEALESSPSSLDKLTLLYKQHKWLHIKEKPEESQLVIVALERIKQDPSQFDLFMKMLCSIKGMDLIVTILTGDIVTPSPFTSSSLHTSPTKQDRPCLSLPSSSSLQPPSTLASLSIPTTHPELTHYADYLRAVYSTCQVAKPDKFPPTPSKKFIKVALVKKEKVSEAQADKFTRLTLQGDIDQILQEKKPIEMDDILKADDEVHLVVIEGAPGIGKSTLAWELCRQWSTMESLKQFLLVVFLRLREERVQSATDISDLFPSYDSGLSSLVAQEITRENGKGVLFIFDDFDEFPSELQEKSLVMDIISGSKYLPKATVLVTNRPSASAQLQALLQKGIGKHIEVVGFSGNEILEFAHSVYGDTNLFTDFRAYLTANAVVKGMMYNPLNCAIVVGVYQDTYESGKPVPHTQTQLYTELTLCLLSRYLSATGDPLARKLPNNLEDLPHDSALYQQLVKVGELAFNGKVKEEVVFKHLPEGCSDLGLLVKHTVLYTRKETITYNFFHLTLQEYMSAFYISQLPADEQRTLFSEHSTSMDVVWRFVAGLTKMKNIGWDEFKRVVRWKAIVYTMDRYEYEVDNDVVTVGPSLLQCLYEAQDMQSCGSVFGHHRVEFPSGYGFSNYGLYALGYCISVCSNIWNITIRNIPSEGLEMLGHGMKSVDYGGGYIVKLDLFESEGFMNEGEQIPQQVLQHIKSLYLMRCSINERGFEHFGECIPYLHSLTSLDISDNPGDGRLAILFQALRKHGKIQKLRIDDMAIGIDDIVALTGLIQPSSSLRELTVGFCLLASDVAKQLVKTMLSPSSLNTVTIEDCEYPLDSIDKISVNISTLSFYNHRRHDLKLNAVSANSSKVKGGTKLSHILRKNTSLKELSLLIPLDEDEVQDIIDSMKDNHSLEWLDLSEIYHSQYFSESVQALDPRITFSTLITSIIHLY